MKSDYLLSICIPSYNREIYLKRLIESIVTQEWFSDSISIVINDWPSTDQTTEMVAEYQKKYSNIFYSKNTKAVGMLPAIMESMNMSNGEYAWLFWSDDYMKPWALLDTLHIIEKEKPSVILHKRKIIHAEWTPSAEEKDLWYKAFDGFSKLSEFLWNNTEYVNEEDINNYFTFMSIITFRTEHFQNSQEKIKKRYTENELNLNKNYFNRAIINYNDLHEGKIIWINCNISVLAQADNHGWTPNKNIVNDLSRSFAKLKKDYSFSKSFIKKINKVEWNRRMSCVVLWPIIRSPITKFIKQNKVTKNIYKFISLCISKLLG